MGYLYTALRKQAPANALRAVETCARMVPEYRATVANPDDYAGNLEFSVLIRRRALDLVFNDHPPTDEYLALFGAAGEKRGRHGITLKAARRLITLHTSGTLREIQEASGPSDLHDGLHMLAWIGANGSVVHQEYSAGVLRGQRHHLPVFDQVGQFAELALAGDPAAPMYAENLGIATQGPVQVVVIRIAGQPETTRKQSEDVVEVAWRRHNAPATWPEPDELVALLPGNQETATLALVRDVAEVTGRPCAAGTVAGPLSTLAETFAVARRVSQAAPPRTDPDHVYTMADVFIEIGVAELPAVDRWLRDLARRLGTGPDLITTLDAYYRHDLDRSRTAGALNVHPRTLDYRLQKAHELTGIDPRGVNGIRVFTTAMTRFAAEG